jgi:hypothetical protein
MSAIIWTIIVSVVPATTPIKPRAPSRLAYKVAKAPQICDAQIITPKMIRVARRPKIFEKGIMRKLEYPLAMTVTPTSRDNWVSLRWNSAARRGNIGAIDRPASTVTKV